MKKSDLRNGMVVETRNGELYLVVEDFMTNDLGFMILQYYNENMLNAEGHYRYDIMKVYEFKNYIFGNNAARLKSLFNKECLTLLWERKERNLTEREVEVLKALHTLGYEWITRNLYGELFAFGKKPQKLKTFWLADIAMTTCIDKDLFAFVKWADNEPTKIKELLK